MRSIFDRQRQGAPAQAEALLNGLRRWTLRLRLKWKGEDLVDLDLVFGGEREERP